MLVKHRSRFGRMGREIGSVYQCTAAQLPEKAGFSRKTVQAAAVTSRWWFHQGTRKFIFPIRLAVKVKKGLCI